ncbi:ArsR/SmtB family transcription factor [Halorarius litoreus]|uniref:ArsR/SmtB family transcription factor n=1 Tax=Halorarius litoreus TaxID=2962676 RepID=UPI0020CC2D1D|nr:helix-turn-helix domain-containing protein [Halorarius litoreus]
MTDSTGTDVPGDVASTPAAAEVFAAVGNETRLAILRALWDAEERPVSFTDLRRTVGIEDSAQFNYHLRQLTGRFVRKTDEGYDLRFAGREMVRAVVIGTFTEDPTLDAFETGGAYVDCGGGLQASYTEELVHIECGDCGRLHSRLPFPASGLRDRSPEELLAAYDRRVRHDYALTVDGVCPACSGRMETQFDPSFLVGVGEGTADECSIPPEFGVEHTYTQCDTALRAAVGMCLLDAPVVGAFYRDNGVDVSAVPYWELPWAMGEDTTLVTDEPLRVAVAVEDDRLRVVVDESLAVVEATPVE